MKNIYIRVDGDNKIGHGHYTRCLALANILSKNFEITFISKSITQELTNKLVINKFKLVKILEESNFISLINKNTIVIIDGYNFDINFQQLVRSKCKKLVYIDDLNSQELEVDLIINHIPGLNSHNYKNINTDAALALGLEYSLLRPAFLKNIKNKNHNNTLNSVFVCFGGSDQFNLSEKIVNYLINIEEIKSIVVVTGSSYENIDSLKLLLAKNQKIKHWHNIDEYLMIDLMNKCSIAIVPASGIMLEALSQNLIVISGYYTENQKNAYYSTLKEGIIFGVDDFNYLSQNNLETLIKEISIKVEKNDIAYNYFPQNKINNLFNLLT
jgi:UDP-2,4-diacetamido-2,4,6-trideoxy-beta-L-altropyranose hydrolase